MSTAGWRGCCEGWSHLRGAPNEAREAQRRSDRHLRLTAPRRPASSLVRPNQRRHRQDRGKY
uniref:Uncharacterized protein n=1 Tax=Arundo donax TaxID=35708 RepID=A0A0A9EIV9_ARUDO